MAALLKVFIGISHYRRDVTNIMSNIFSVSDVFVFDFHSCSDDLCICTDKKNSSIEKCTFDNEQ